MNNVLKGFIFLIIFLVNVLISNAQITLVTNYFDENSLVLASGSGIVNDPTADGGKAVFRSTSSSNGTFWYGPYRNIQGGNYIVQFRMKVSDNASNDHICRIDVVSSAGGIEYALLSVKPSMFRKANEWQLISLPVVLNANITDVEVRGIEFAAGITDVYLDYVNIVPGDLRSFYSPEFTVTGKGSVGIGIKEPDAKLSVNGNIRAKEVKVETANWPDYVFNPAHTKPTLEELETYIKANKHLPEIPSMGEVEQNGVNLGEINATFLKKLEELTLYLIEINKKMQKLEGENLELKKAVKMRRR